jgi:hypothetical protein
MPADPIETAKLSAARAVVELVWDEKSITHIFNIKYEGANWEVIVRIKPKEDGDISSSPDKDFIEELPE